MRILVGVLVVALAGAALWLLGPREPVGQAITFDPDTIGADIDAYLYNAERRVPGLKSQTQKHVLWADPARKNRTEYALVYIHGFSATHEEVRPVPDRVARSLGANIYFARLTGHGQNGAALARATVPDWRRDVAEALEIGRRIGDKVIVIGTSTGATLITLALEGDTAGVAGVVMLSPNFGLRARGSSLLTWPFARQFVPAILGRERMFAPENQEHGQWWTTRYPTVALLPMAAAVRAANAVDHDRIRVPALFIFSDADQVVDSTRSRRVAADWGGPVSVWPVRMGAGDDRASHVIAGRILSPSLTEPVTERILEWVKERGL